jgi:uncharacterized membrane protein YbhN (UPF0104 family)
LNYIFKTFHNEQKGIGDIAKVVDKIYSPRHLLVLIFMIILVPVNWALEAKKWQRLTERVTKLSFWEALKGTLTGLAVGVAAPAQLGDTIGRIAALRHERKLEAVGAALISNGIQFYVSTCAGALGWLYLKDSLQIDEVSKRWISASLILVIAIGFIVAPWRKKLSKWNPGQPLYKKILSYLQIIATYDASELATATLFGLLRYLVFLTQFVLALSMFDFPLDAAVLSACVSIIFLVKTFIPAINVLGDLGLREFTALFVFRQYHLPPEEIIAATFLIWIINIFGPIMIGIFLIWKYKWADKND